MAFEGYIHNNNAAMSVALNNVPPGVYNFIAYGVGFSFNATYEQSFSLAGADLSPTLHVKAQTGLDFGANPVLTRMASTDAGARDFGNYVMFENVSPDASGNLTLFVTPESPNPGNLLLDRKSVV